MQISDVKTRAAKTIDSRRSKRIIGSLPIEAEMEEKTETLISEQTTPLTLAESATTALSTPTATTSSCSSSSTPRRKRVDTTLSNLHSNLSPKYIGFVTPPSVSSSANDAVAFNSAERTRRSRRRQLNTSSNETSSATPPNTEILGPCIRRTTTNQIAEVSSPDAMTAPLRNKQFCFVSPIDKLLLKNGSTSPAAASMFEPLNSTAAVASKNSEVHSSPLTFGARKTRSQLLAQTAIIAALTLPEPIDLETILPSSSVEKHLPSLTIQGEQLEQSKLFEVPHQISDNVINSDKDAHLFEVTDAPEVELDPASKNSEHSSHLSFKARKIRSKLLAQTASIAALTLPDSIDLEAIVLSSSVEQHLPSLTIQGEPLQQSELSEVPHKISDNVINSDKDAHLFEVTDALEVELDSASKNSELHSSHLSFEARKTRSQLLSQTATIAALTLPDSIDLEAIVLSSSVEQHLPRDESELIDVDAILSSSLVRTHLPSLTIQEEQQKQLDESELSEDPLRIADDVINSDKDALLLEVTHALEMEEDPAELDPENQFFKYEEDHTNEWGEEGAADGDDGDAVKEKDSPIEKEEPPVIVIDDDNNEEELQLKLTTTQPEVEVSLHDDAAMNDDLPVVSAAAKSPSAVSTDSAKGSSVINDAAWMTFATGDLFWGQIYSYCYWPCMVCPDPDGKTITIMEAPRIGSTDQHLVVHVRFFADNGRRNWVKRENLMQFLGLESYQERIAEVEEKYGSKSQKYKQLVPQKSKQLTWREAVKEANIVAEVLHSERLEKYFEIYENSKAFQKIQRKRRLSMMVSLSSTSDMGSLYGSTDNLFAKTSQQQPNLTLAVAATTVDAATKRDRSVSPFSPAFSPVKSITSMIKRRKLSNSSTNNNNSNELQLLRTPTQTHQQRHLNGELDDSELVPTSQASSSSASALPTEMDGLFADSEFKKFYFAMKSFVMAQNQDDKLERSLMVAVRNIWALKQINHSQMLQHLTEQHDQLDLGSSLVENSTGGIGRRRPAAEGSSLKRLSNRLKNMMIRRSLPDAAMSTQVREATEESALPLQSKTTSAKKPLNRPIEEVINNIFNLDNKYLFQGLGREPVCKYCYKYDNKLVRCTKEGCQSWLHADCIGKSLKGKDGKRTGRRSKTIVSLENIPIEDVPIVNHITADEEDSKETEAVPEVVVVPEELVVCTECAQKKPAACAVCGVTGNSTTTATSNEGVPLVFCSMAHCGKAFHPTCCKYWPQSKITKSKNSIESFRCPSHVCHTCVSDDPKGKFQHLSNAKLTKCVCCPATYHTDSTCIPAGSQILTAAHIICPRHNSAARSSDVHVNVGWCFICVGGGQLVCCETCPTAVHAACLNIPIDPDAGYICEECESGRMPLYGEMVWARFNSFRWWPAIILPPTEVPHNIVRKTHHPYEFVVRFFGTHDHGWISRRRVYLYLEGDSSEPLKSKSHLNNSYNRGVEEAKQIHEIVKLKKQTQRLANESKEKLHPQPYVRIKVNRAVPPVRLPIDFENVSKCECNADAYDPCGPDSNCLNRVLYHECNPKLCPAGERCQNQMFESRISPRLDIVYMKERGFGLVCREFIAVGTFVIEYVGEIINDDEFRQRMQQMSSDRDENFYFLSVEKDYIIDAGPKGNLARFMNHSCDPNCETQKWSVNGLNRVGLFAIKDISPDTELTFNYHWDELLGSEKKTCFCGAAKCAGQIGEKYKQDKVLKTNVEVQKKSKGRPALNSEKSTKPVKRLQDKMLQKKKKKKVQIKINAIKASPKQAKTKKGSGEETHLSATETH